MPLSFYIISNLPTQNNNFHLMLHSLFHGSVQTHGIFRFQKQQTNVQTHLFLLHNAHIIVGIHDTDPTGLCTR